MKENKSSDFFKFIGSLIAFSLFLNLLTWGANEIPMVKKWKEQNKIKNVLVTQEQIKEYQTYTKGKFKIEPLFSQTSKILKAYDFNQWPTFGIPSITISIFKIEKYYLVYESLDSCNNYKKAYSVILPIKESDLNCQMIN